MTSAADELEQSYAKKSLKDFVTEHLPPKDEWSTWTHPKTKEEYSITIQKAGSLPKPDFEACFNFIEFTSGEDYKRSKDGWHPKNKKNEMRFLALKYLLVKKGDQVDGFCSFMPTVEDEYFVIYCYEIHLAPSLQGTGLGKMLMEVLASVAKTIPEAEKVMLTVFRRNKRALQFYEKLGFAIDDFSPPPSMLRNGKMVEKDYLILSKPVAR